MSKQVEIKLGAIDDVKDFVNIVSKYDFDVDLSSDRHSIDAKSILGIFSLDLSKPVKVDIQSDDCLDFLAEINRFAVK
ncbi:MAG: HPr family phosphocarrier protein [Clostridiales bacterium]|jgi:phosphotransferase system HPr-like phosphotransfer protein|nr:HPr family phosphocarrier protein [Clostridiales bacterium]